MRSNRTGVPRLVLGAAVFAALLLLGIGAFLIRLVWFGPSESTQETEIEVDGWRLTVSNVGLAPLGLTCESLPVYSGEVSVPRGTIISGVRVTNPLDLSAGGIVVENSCIQPVEAGLGLPVLTTQSTNTMHVADDKVVLRNNQIDGTKLASKTAALATAVMGNADVVGNHIHGFGSGIAIMNSGRDLDILVQRNYVTGLVSWGDPATDGNHSSAFTVRDFTTEARSDRKLIVRGNRFNATSGSDTGALFIQTYSGSIANVLIRDNLLEGNGYQLGLNETSYPYRNLRALNNRFSGTGWGPSYVQGGGGWLVWENNFLHDPRNPDGRGDAVSAP